MTENQPDPLTQAPIDEDSAAHDDAHATEVTPSPEKDPSDWVTGDQPMTGPQGSYLHTLAQEAGHDVPDDLSKADASRMIDELQAETGRGGA